MPEAVAASRIPDPGRTPHLEPFEQIDMHTPLAGYLSASTMAGKTPDPGFIAYLASLEQISKVSPEVAKAVVSELADQRCCLKIIASENFCSLAVQPAQGIC